MDLYIIILTEVKESLKLLKQELIQIDTVNWKKYAVIIRIIAVKNETFLLIKHLSEETLDAIQG